MTLPRIIFTSFERADNPTLKPWREHRRWAIGSPSGEAEDSSDGAVIWRMVSGNNRELARSADIYRDFAAAAFSAMVAVTLTEGDVVVSMTSGERSRTFGWYISVNGAPVVACSRQYVSERQQQQSVQLAIESLANANVAGEARAYVSFPHLRPVR